MGLKSVKFCLLHFFSMFVLCTTLFIGPTEATNATKQHLCIRARWLRARAHTHTHTHTHTQSYSPLFFTPTSAFQSSGSLLLHPPQCVAAGTRTSDVWRWIGHIYQHDSEFHRAGCLSFIRVLDSVQRRDLPSVTR